MTLVIAIDGSHRRGGSVSTMVEEVARGAEAAGATVERVRLADLRIEHCRGCMACRRSGRCPIRDDFAALAERILAADGFIVGTPSYHRQMCGAVKVLFDRLTGFVAEHRLEGRSFRIQPRLRGRRTRAGRLGERLGSQVPNGSGVSSFDLQQLLLRVQGALRTTSRPEIGAGPRGGSTAAPKQLWPPRAAVEPERLVRYLQSLVGDAHRAEDLAQEAFRQLDRAGGSWTWKWAEAG